MTTTNYFNLIRKTSMGYLFESIKKHLGINGYLDGIKDVMFHRKATPCGANAVHHRALVKFSRSANCLVALFLLGMLFFSTTGLAQITIIVTRLPENTPPNPSIYLAGNFNEWDPKSEDYKLVKQPDGKYKITLSVELNSIEYKFTRGSWKTVESDIDGNKIENRTYTVEKKIPITIYAEITTWEDLKIKFFFTILVTRIPENTPSDASIYIAGDFNNWKENDPQYRLVKQHNGVYLINFPRGINNIKYKFTRGTWLSVECKNNGRHLYNRILKKDPNIPTTYTTKIEAWEDLVGGVNYVYTIIIFASAMQGIVLLFAFWGMPGKNKESYRFLSLLLFLLTLTLLGRATSYNRDIFTWQPKLLLVSDLIYFLYAPLFYLYIQKLLGGHAGLKDKKWLILIPACVHLILYLPLIVMPDDQFIIKMIDHEFYYLFNWIGAAAFVFNLVFAFVCFDKMNKYEKNTLNKSASIFKYINFLLIQHLLCLSVWLFSYLSFGVALLLKYDSEWINEGCINILWVFVSSFSYTYGYFCLSQPELFKQKEENIAEREEYSEKQKSSTLGFVV